MRCESGQRGHELNSESEQKLGPSSAKTQLKPNKHLSHLQAALARGYKERDIPEPRGKLEPAEGGAQAPMGPPPKGACSPPVSLPASQSKQVVQLFSGASKQRCTSQLLHREVKSQTNKQKPREAKRQQLAAPPPSTAVTG